MPDHLVSFARMWAAFPPSLAGRDSGDYYETSVAVGFAPGRRSHVRRCRTSERDVGAPFISLNAFTGHRSWLRRLHRPCSISVAEPAPVSGVIPVDVNFHLLEIGIQAIQLSPYHAGSPPHRSRRLDTTDRYHGMLVPFTFRIQVSHQTQEPPSEFLPAALGIQQGASRRIGSAAGHARWGGSVS